MNIKPSDLVLEVGSGDKPYPRSDVLLDKLPEDSSQREAGRGLVIDRPFVIGDVETLPFADKSFEYIIASHILEHAQDPAKFLDELSRVGKRGYVETPLPLRERVFDWPFHRWYVDQEGKVLVLVKKTKKSKKFFAGMSADKRKELYFLEGKKLLNLKFEWEGKIKYKILPQEPDKFLEDLDKKLMKLQAEASVDELAPGRLMRTVKWLKDNLFKVKFGFERRLQARERKKGVDVFSLIVCPSCKNKLERQEAKFTCLGCGRKYTFLREKIPKLLP